MSKLNREGSHSTPDQTEGERGEGGNLPQVRRPHGRHHGTGHAHHGPLRHRGEEIIGSKGELKSNFGFKVREISIRPTTDTLREIGTVTKDSIPIAFKGVQVRK